MKKNECFNRLSMILAPSESRRRATTGIRKNFMPQLSGCFLCRGIGGPQ
jgi:hypothetical protein